MMICEYNRNRVEHDIEDRYIQATLDGCVHYEATKVERLLRLKYGDILVIASAKTLSTDPIHLLWCITHLAQKGVQIHFVQEGVVIRGNACDQTSHVVAMILSLFGDIPSSCRHDKDLSCMVEQGSSGRHDPNLGVSLLSYDQFAFGFNYKEASL